MYHHNVATWQPVQSLCCWPNLEASEKITSTIPLAIPAAAQNEGKSHTKPYNHERLRKLKRIRSSSSLAIDKHV